MENTNVNRYPTPVAINRCISNEGKEYIAAAMPLTLINIEEVTTETGKKVLRARAAVTKKSKILADYLGITLPDEETLWISVRLWENLAESLIKYATDESGNIRNTKVTIAGTLSSREFTRNDGSQGIDITLNGNTWWR